MLPQSGSSDSIVLLYRANTSENWRIINFVKTGSTNFGYLTTSNLQKGEYTFGVGKPGQSAISEEKSASGDLLEIYPNPSNDTFYIKTFSEENGEIRIYNSLNQLVWRTSLIDNESYLVWAPPQSGNYFVFLYIEGKPVKAEKVVCFK